MGTRSFQASEKGIKKAEIALAQYSLSQNALAEDLGLSRSTVNNFFKGKPIDRENFGRICDRLGLDVENTVALRIAISKSGESNDCLDTDVLVQEIRQKVYTYIQKKCGEMRVLDMTRPIDLNTIYTYVNVLQDITGRQRLTLAELLKRCTVEEFDRLGFSHARTERRSGLEAVQEFDKLMLLGKPGAGKTTFLKRLATLCNAGTFQKSRVPIFIMLKDFGDSSRSPKLLPYISQWLQDLDVQNPQHVEQILIHGQGFLLLDGLDEVSEKVSKQVMQEIQSFATRFSQNAFVVSCRIAAREFTFQQFTEVEVADFNEAQITDFATRWFQVKQLPEKTKKFLEKLEEYPRIKELATNPLLLTLLCLVFEGRTDFPVNRSELYEEGLDVLLKKWDSTRSIEREQVYRELSLKRKEDLLSQLAFATFEPGNYFFKQKDTERLIEAYIQNLPGAKSDPEALRLDSEAVLKSIEAQHGLLVERARGIYSFSHLAFHEFFTACHIDKSGDPYQILCLHLTEKRWRDVFLLTVGLLEKADFLLLSIKSQIDEMIATDKKLQQFLTWVQQKACSIKAPYTPAAIRAFYFTLDLDLSFDFNLDPTLIYDLDLAQNFTFTLDLTRGFDHLYVRDLTNDPDLLHLGEILPALPLSLDFTLIRDRNSILSIIRDIDLNKGLNFDCDLQRDLDINLVIAMILDLDPALQKALKEFRKQILYPGKHLPSEHRWKTDGSSWVAKIESIMVEHRNIGHNWRFKTAHEQQLQQYYNANKLLVDCLNSDCYVSREVRQEIEASLLLPIADLERQFPNQRRSRYPKSIPSR